MTRQSEANRECILAALVHLGGAGRAIDTEDLAMHVASLAPGRFRWRKYPEQINLESVHSIAKSLLRDKQPLITGSKRDGWMLTQAGMGWCSAVLGKETVKATLGELTDPTLTLRQTKAFQKFQQQEMLSLYDVRQLLRVDEYSSKRRRRERIQATLNAAGDDMQILQLIAHIRDHFAEEWRW